MYAVWLFVIDVLSLYSVMACEVWSSYIKTVKFSLYLKIVSFGNNHCLLLELYGTLKYPMSTNC